MRQKGQILDLKGLRNFLNLSQKEIAEAVKRPSSFLSAIEHGKRSAPRAFLEELVRLYNIENIDAYLSDPIPSGNGTVRNVKNSLVNSPGGMYVPSDVAKEVNHKDTEYPTGDGRVKDDSPTTYQAFLHLLMKSENRLAEAQARIRTLEAEVKRLNGLLESHSNT
ncbi:MAG: helix-turn-helix domain-containing protein [Muribaculaceae bacterium]|nr:helix-turn-helix domain-containing protein [Muribaculaceae bacterium]